uniref:SUN domain-containing protein 1-like n=1 Tax=Diabrotica virgifera virgifera TaxID=50390 RepID=A0A6P7F1H4_DIAVI
MFNSRGVCSTPRARPNNWLKYVLGLCLLVSLYIIIVLIHNAQQIRNLSEEVAVLKHEIDNIFDENRIYAIEDTLNSVKRQQEYLERNVKSFINEELETFGADKTGQVDFALEASGGKIVKLSPDTQSFNLATTVFGIPVCEGSHSPRAMLQADMSPGHCWAIKGSYGGAVVKLIGKVHITAFTLEHISRHMSPTNEVTSAPRDFEVWGLNDDLVREEYLGRFSYELNGQLFQTFPVDSSNNYEYVEFIILTNHYHPVFTCIYRFRVHGILKVNMKN